MQQKIPFAKLKHIDNFAASYILQNVLGDLNLKKIIKDAPENQTNYTHKFIKLNPRSE